MGMMKRGKKTIAMLLIAVFAVQAAGCGKPPEPPADSLTEESEPVQSASSTTDIQEEPISSVPEDAQAEEPGEPDGIDWGDLWENGVDEQIMRVKTGIYDRELTPEDLQTVTELEVDAGYLSGGNWISLMPNLKVLKLSRASYKSNNIGINDLDFLSGMTQLEELDLSGENSFKDISALAGLASLKTLSLSCGNRYLDVSVLAGLTNLTAISLEKFDAADVEVLSGLTNLTSLTLDFGSNSGWPELDLSALSGLTNLTTLILTGSAGQLNDIGFLSGLTKLTTLVIDSASNQGLGLNTPDLSVLSGLTNLERLELGFNIDYSEWTTEGRSNVGADPYSINLSPLSALTNLKVLKLGSYSYHSDLSVLSALTNLEELDICRPMSIWDGDKLVAYGGDMSGLGGLTNLRTLILSGWWGVNDVASLPVLPNLTTLSIMCEESSYTSSQAMEEAGVAYRDPFERKLQNLPNLTTLIWRGGTDEMEAFKLPTLTALLVEGGDMDMAVGIHAIDDWTNLTTLVLKDGILSGQNDSNRGWRAEWNAYFPNVTNLTLIGFNEKDNVSALSGLQNLTSLTLDSDSYQGGRLLPELPDLSNLTELVVINYRGDGANLSHLTNLTSVVIEQSDSFPYSQSFSYSSFSGLQNLTTLLGVNRDFNEIATFQNLKNITFPYKFVTDVYEKGDVSILQSMPDVAIEW